MSSTAAPAPPACRPRRPATLSPPESPNTYVRFGLDGTQYEIDLSPAHAGELRATLARYAEAARKISGTARRPSRNGRTAAANGHRTTQVRDWAKAQGIEIKDRGRVPAGVLAKFQAATSK